MQSGGHLPCAHAQWHTPTVTLSQWHPPTPWLVPLGFLGTRGARRRACVGQDPRRWVGWQGTQLCCAQVCEVLSGHVPWPDRRWGSSDLGPPRRSGGFPAPVCTWPRVPGLGFLLPLSLLPSSWSVPEADGGAGGGSWLSLVGIKYLILNVLSAAAKTLA